MKRIYYAVYDLSTDMELCLGVWDSVRELSTGMKISRDAAYRNLYQTRRGRKFSRTKISVHRIPKK